MATVRLRAFHGARIHSRAMVVSAVKPTGLTTNVVVLAGQIRQLPEALAAVLAAQHQQVALVALTDPPRVSMRHQVAPVTATASQVSPRITAVAVAAAHGVAGQELPAVMVAVAQVQVLLSALQERQTLAEAVVVELLVVPRVVPVDQVLQLLGTRMFRQSPRNQLRSRSHQVSHKHSA